eukprot:640361-Amphidinium_carterae.1
MQDLKNESKRQHRAGNIPLAQQCATECKRARGRAGHVLSGIQGSIEWKASGKAHSSRHPLTCNLRACVSPAFHQSASQSKRANVVE